MGGCAWQQASISNQDGRLCVAASQYIVFVILVYVRLVLQRLARGRYAAPLDESVFVEVLLCAKHLMAV